MRKASAVAGDFPKKVAFGENYAAFSEKDFSCIVEQQKIIDHILANKERYLKLIE